jgi:hypothetical protein
MANYKNSGGMRAIASKRTAICLAVGMALGTISLPSLYAQEPVGSVAGSGTPGQAVTLRNTDTNATRSSVAGANGEYSFREVPPGDYEVVVGGNTTSIVVTVGTTSRVGAAVEEVVVFGGRRANPIDLKSSEVVSVFSAEDLLKLPVSRDVTSVALLAPGTTRGDTGFGNLAAFGGSSVAENGYYINGFDVTNIRYFLSYADLPFEAIGSQEVKTGGYGAEYGRSLGGVVSLVTKSGSNEWHGGLSSYANLSRLSSSGQDVFSQDPEDQFTQYYSVFRSENESDNVVTNGYVSGPIIKDKLFFFGLIQAQDYESNTYGYSSSRRTTANDPKGMVKIDWNIAENHSLEFTGIWNKEDTKYQSYKRETGNYSGIHETLDDSYTSESGGEVYIAKYTGNLTDTLTVSAMYGSLEYSNPYRAVPAANLTCPRVIDTRVGATNTYPGCYSLSSIYATDMEFGPDLDTRDALRIDASWLLGDHTIRFGYDDEEFTSGHAGSVYTGGIYWRYFTAPASGKVNGVQLPAGTKEYVRSWLRNTTSGSYDIENSAIYIEDSWQISDSLMLYGGLRQESFKNFNGDRVAFADSGDMIAPRLGFTWDALGNEKLKVYGTYGRYHIPLSGDLNIRASAGELFVADYYTFSAIDPVTWAPTLGIKLGDTQNIGGDGSAPDPLSITTDGLEPMYQDEYILGAQYQLTDNWVAGARYIYRNIANGFEDTCSHDQLILAVRKLGITDYEGSTLPSCMYFNPGEDLSIKLNVDEHGGTDYRQVTLSADELGYPEYQRKYHAVELTAQGNLDERMSVIASYVWSHSYGNIEGYVNSSLEQADPGLTQDFDYQVFTDGAYGDLPNDRRHTLKVFGTYDLGNLDFGLSFIGQTGRPVNCFGYGSTENMDPNLVDSSSISLYGPSSFYCRDTADGSRRLAPRGSAGNTPITYNVDAHISYAPPMIENLTVTMDVFNLLNNRRVTEYNEVADKSSVTNETDPNYLTPVNFQAPIRARLSFRYDF